MIMIIIYILINLLINQLTINSFKHSHEIYYDLTTLHHYLIINNTFCQIANDNQTIEILGFKRNESNIINNIYQSDYLPNQFIDCPIKLRSHSGNQCHNNRLKLIQINQILNNNLSIITSIHKYGKYFNPSLLLFHNKFILTQRFHPKLGILSLSLNSLKELVYITTESIQSYESDYRLIQITNNKILLVFTKEHFSPHVYTAIRELIYYSNNNTYYLSKSIKLDVNNPNLKEKNWTPFLYYNEIFFIRKIFPLEIIKLNQTEYLSSFMGLPMIAYNTSQASFSNCRHMSYCSGSSWKYGEIRGGTPARYIPGYGYLGFFHSAYYMCHYIYVIGAYIFSSTLPFRLLKMSHYPIVHNELIYDFANWNHGMSVVFPMSYYMEDRDGNIVNDQVPHTIVISAGYNDTDGIIIRIDFNKLVDSLIDVSC